MSLAGMFSMWSFAIRIAAEAVLGSNCYFSLQNKIKMEKHILSTKENMIKWRSRSQLHL